MTRRRRTHQLIETCEDPSDRASRAVDVLVLALIVVSVVAAMIESISWVGLAYRVELDILEGVVLAIFGVEYVLRVWACVEDPEYAAPIAGRLRYATQPLMLVDLLALLPAMLPAAGLDLVAVRVLRLVRVFRVAKLTRYSRALRLLGRVVWGRRNELGVTLYLAVLMVVSAGTVMYVLERPAQPEVFSNIPVSCWWAVTTLTTIGYGDMAPVTPLGRLVASCISICALGLFALPAGILGSGFVEALDEVRSRRAGALCVRCGEHLAEADG